MSIVAAHCRHRRMASGGCARVRRYLRACSVAALELVAVWHFFGFKIQQEGSLALIFNFEATMNKTDNNMSARLCLVVKDPFQQYIDEWADYHIMALGFISLQLYDNTDKFIMKDWGIQRQSNHEDALYSKHHS